MDDPIAGDVTLLLERLNQGDSEAEGLLAQCVYAELRRLAGKFMSQERQGHTLQPTALVSEAYLRLCRQGGSHWRNRGHFYAVAAKMMRRVLVDYARQKNALKRPSPKGLVDWDDSLPLVDCDLFLAVEIDEALDKLAELNPRQARVVELKFFAGLHDQEIASALGVALRTVRRDWFMARAWLHAAIGEARGPA